MRCPPSPRDQLVGEAAAEGFRPGARNKCENRATGLFKSATSAALKGWRWSILHCRQLALGKLAGLELWGAARGEHTTLIRELGATPIDYQREDFACVLPGGFDVVFDGIGEDGYRRSFAALKPGGLLCAYGYSAGVQAQRSMLGILMWIARLYLWRWLPGGKRARFYSINVMRARHPAWFKEDLGRLFGLLASGSIRPRVAERISFEEVAEAHRRMEAGGLEGKLVLCPDQTSRTNRAAVSVGT